MFTRKYTLNQHMNTHSGNKQFQCSQCLKYFHSTKQRLKHIEASHKDKSYTCNICEKEFTTQYNLNTHMKLHSGTGNIYQCDSCCSNFKHKSDLKKHQSIHSDATSFICDFCEMSFKFKNSLKRHKKTHTGERVHQCENV